MLKKNNNNKTNLFHVHKVEVELGALGTTHLLCNILLKKRHKIRLIKYTFQQINQKKNDLAMALKPSKTSIIYMYIHILQSICICKYYEQLLSNPVRIDTRTQQRLAI